MFCFFPDAIAKGFFLPLLREFGPQKLSAKSIIVDYCGLWWLMRHLQASELMNLYITVLLVKLYKFGSYSKVITRDMTTSKNKHVKK